ncbi:uncharacterized protein LOC123499558 isoform X2 [Portunus trituberculatus]|uniref:uncharacterized protein LOC123499558 isoform X2 n=1 Tax=Portunus trituberculatus TaxID=210409 RepID=UPI001E1CBC25|nr:uncharacterized protein LOC123499558 isoform X2 [Portunus trituberculatus]XP_045103610.1 uncharacterized protein LOC123499558 isoform X2 [Portunus trituberculatus]
MTTDSEDADSFDQLRTLCLSCRHRNHSSSSSECSCESCISHSDDSFFEGDEGPPGGENTVQRRLYMWLENAKLNWGFLVLGLLLVSMAFTITIFAVAETSSNIQVSHHTLYWMVPMMAVTAGVVIAWKTTQHLLLKQGYGKGGHIMERWNLIRVAQRKKLVYSVRGAIYAPTRSTPQRPSHPPTYKMVGYESEFDSETYFDSDLESDGQYRRSLTPWQEVEDPHKRERRNIYTRKAWFRDVPVVWWELIPCTQQKL